MLDSGVPVHELRYERMAADPEGTAEDLAVALDAPTEPFADALDAAHAGSIGRYERDLSPEQLADVEAEAGALLGRLGY